MSEVIWTLISSGAADLLELPKLTTLIEWESQ